MKSQIVCTCSACEKEKPLSKMLSANFDSHKGSGTLVCAGCFKKMNGRTVQAYKSDMFMIKWNKMKKAGAR